MNSRWMERAEALNAAVADRLSDASDRLASTLQAANDALGNGADYARGVGRSLRVGAQRGERSARALIAERPFESVLIVGAFGIAIGWLWRRMHEPRDEPTPARPNGARRPAARARAARSRSANRAAAD